MIHLYSSRGRRTTRALGQISLPPDQQVHGSSVDFQVPQQEAPPFLFANFTLLATLPAQLLVVSISGHIRDASHCDVVIFVCFTLGILLIARLFQSGEQMNNKLSQRIRAFMSASKTRTLPVVGAYPPDSPRTASLHQKMRLSCSVNSEWKI